MIVVKQITMRISSSVETSSSLYTDYNDGYYEGRYYFVFEKLCRSLSFLISDSSLEVTECDLAYVAYQILEILSYCFSRNKILKNIHINDFYIRRTTRGCRVILLNQDFIDGYNIFLLH